jgi:NADPH2:quinone reductase
MRAWRAHEFGAPSDVLRLEEVPTPEPGPGEVLVRTQAVPLNLNDLERIAGGPVMVPVEHPIVPGMEVMGVVEAAGDGAEALVGQRVVATTKQACGGWAEAVVCPAVSTFPVPDAIALPDAAAFYFPFHLAWLGLVDRAHLMPGESVLVHAAAGGSGSAAVQLAKHLGARVFATVGSAEKAAVVRDLGADVVIDRTLDAFEDVVLAETDGEGVDVVFDNVGEAVFEASLKATAYDGRYLMMGFASNKAVADEPFVVPRRVALSNIKLCGVLFAYAPDDIRGLVKQAMGWNFASAERGAAIHREVVALVEQGAVRPLVGSTVAFEDLPAAMEALAAGRTIGRTIALL